MDPWGTPQITRDLSEKMFSTCTLKILLDRQNSNHFVTSLEKPTVSKTFCKSIKIMPVNNPESNPFATLSCR